MRQPNDIKRRMAGKNQKEQMESSPEAGRGTGHSFKGPGRCYRKKQSLPGVPSRGGPKSRHVVIPAAPKPVGIVNPLLDPPVPFVLLAPPGVILSSNAMARQLLALPEEKELRSSLDHFVAREQLVPFRNFLRAAFEAPESLRGHFNFRLKNQLTPMEVICRRGQIEPAESPLLGVLLLDQRETSGSRAWLKPNYDQQPLAGALPVVFWRAKIPFQLTFMSQQVERLAGYPLQAWLHDSYFWQKMIHVDDRERVLNERARAIRQFQAHTMDYRLIRQDGSTLWVRDSSVIEKMPGGMLQLCGCMMDISEPMQMLEALRAAHEELERRSRQQVKQLEQSIQSMETFCYGIAHDLRAPLRAIQGFQDILFSQYAHVFDEEARSYAERMSKGTAHMGQLVKDLLSYGQLTAAAQTPQRLNPSLVIEEALGMLDLEVRSSNARIEVKRAFPPVLAQRGLLREVLVNLLGNALKFHAAGVAPEIRVTAMELENEQRRKGHSMVRIAVSDNGIGVPERLRERIFEVFQKEHPPHQYAGTGIGLAIVKRSVEIMGGTVSFRSDPGHGSTFWFDLPAG